MGKINISLSDSTEKRLRLFIAEKYPLKIRGKISSTIEEAIETYIKSNSVV